MYLLLGIKLMKNGKISACQQKEYFCYISYAIISIKYHFLPNVQANIIIAQVW